jgi:hypothetical protein
MKIKRNRHASPPPRSRALGLPWSLVSHPRRLGPSVASHLGVATLTGVLLALVRPDPALAPQRAIPCGVALGRSPEALVEPPAPSEMSVDLRGGSPSPHGRPEIRSFASDDLLGVVVRHNGRRSDEARLLVRAQPLSGLAPSAEAGPEIFVALDPRRVVWQGQALHYEGQAKLIMPLGRGLWRLTFMISDPRECEHRPLHVCAKVDAWLEVQ